MKNTITNVVLISLCLVFWSPPVFAQKRKLVKIKTVDKLAKKFVMGLKAQEFKRIAELFPPEKEMVSQFREEADLSASRERKAISNLRDLNSEENLAYYKQNFIDLFEKGEQLGVDYVQLDYLGVDFRINKDKPQWESDLAYIRIQYFNNYFLLPIHAIKIKGGWYLLPIIKGEAMISKWMKPQNVVF